MPRNSLAWSSPTTTTLLGAGGDGGDSGEVEALLLQVDEAREVPPALMARAVANLLASSSTFLTFLGIAKVIPRHACHSWALLSIPRYC